MAKIVCLLMLFVVTMFQSNAQSNNDESYPVIGRPLPSFTLSNVKHYKKQKVSYDDFRGKWLVIDFWNSMCKPCLKSFPKVNELQKHFKNDIKFLLVANDDSRYYGNTERMYERMKAQYDLDLTVAFDTILFRSFGVSSVPHVVVVDNMGIVRAITFGDDINKDNLLAFVNGGDPKVRQKKGNFDDAARVPVNLSKPLLIAGNAGADTSFLYRSILSKWNSNIPQEVIHGSVAKFSRHSKYQATGVILRWLYNLAYIGVDEWIFDDSLYGHFVKFPILNVRNPDDFNENFSLDKNIYNYSTIFPKSRKDPSYLQNVLQGDLKRYFGYNVSLEYRDLPYWSLVVTKNKAKDLLKSSGQGETTGDASGYDFKSITIKDLLRAISSFYPYDPPFINETGIVGNIDIEMNAFMLDFKSVKSELNRNGLDLVQKKKRMGVLVISDP